MTVVLEKSKFVFIHVPKTAGVSISTWLQRKCKAKYYKKNIHGAKHLDQKRIQKLLLSDEHDPNDYTYFTIVRNPYDRLVSAYHYYYGKGRMPHTFEEYIKGDWVHDWGCAKKQMHQYFDYEADNVKILRFENLQEDFKQIQNHLEKTGQLPKIRNKSKHEDYQTYYTDELREIVEERCAKDLKIFEYSYK